MKCLDFVPHAQQRLLLRLILFPLLFVTISILKKLGKIYELYINGMSFKTVYNVIHNGDILQPALNPPLHPKL